MRKIWTILLIMLTCLPFLIITGCGKKQGVIHTPPPRQVSAEELTAYAGQGYTVDIPKSWRRLPNNPGELYAGFTEDLFLYTAATSDSSSIKVVIKSPAGESTAEAFLRYFVKGPLQHPLFKSSEPHFSSFTGKLPGAKATLTILDTTTSGEVVYHLFAFIKDGKGFILDCEAFPEKMAKEAELYERIAKTFR